MTSLDELLGEEYATPEARLYLELAREDQDLLATLIEIRKSRMSQDEVAQKLGLTQATVSAFERIGNDPKFSTVRRYAKAIGVMVRHQVDPTPCEAHDSSFLSHVSRNGVLSTETAAAKARNLSRHATPWPNRMTKRVEDLRPKQMEEMVDVDAEARVHA